MNMNSLRHLRFYDPGSATFRLKTKRRGRLLPLSMRWRRPSHCSSRKNNLRLAATSCRELAEFYTEHQQLLHASDFYEQAADYYGANRRSKRFCRFKAKLLRFTLANEEMLCAIGMVPLKDCKRRSSKHIKSSDPDWGAQVSQLFSSTSTIQPWM
ncbi:hypothetical protein HU200_031634 [Digitaria exilis]|uniref:Uncharacterized protein n=1 Tax=Digitaria exilis TaxID=1010633 RepID=A0A835BQJ4_9POAL|nr:hypothetical protein HU200_031634 [Digitaria exilis]